MNPKENIHESWKPIIPLLHQEPLCTLSEQILPNISYQPKAENIFKVFNIPVQDVKVVILGQDPYPTPGDAIGRAFAVSEDRKIPASLRIIREEILNSCGSNSFQQNTGENWKTLQHWEKQGVLLLNTALTVESGKAGSHLKYWEDFTKRIISFISSTNPCIWLIWGKKAEAFIPYINHAPFRVKGYDLETIKSIPANNDWNYILNASHPAAETYSGGNAGFYGCNHFIYVNEILRVLRKKEINW